MKQESRPCTLGERQDAPFQSVSIMDWAVSSKTGGRDLTPSPFECDCAFKEAPVVQ